MWFASDSAFVSRQLTGFRSEYWYQKGREYSEFKNKCLEDDAHKPVSAKSDYWIP